MRIVNLVLEQRLPQPLHDPAMDLAAHDHRIEHAAEIIAAIPADVLETAQAFGVRGGLFWKRILIPSIAPSFVTGSIAACGGGWNALVLSEYVRYRGTTYSTTGIGALLLVAGAFARRD